MSEKALCVFTCNDDESNLVYFGPQKAVAISKEMVMHSIPDFVVEGSSESTEKYDRGVNFERYAAHGAKEYWIIACR